MKPLETLESTSPVFFKASEAPWPLTVEEICEATEKKIGRGNIAGSVRKGQIWRIHPKTAADKVKLLGGINTLTIMRKSGENDEAEVTLHSKNPSNIIMRDGTEVPTVKLIIDGLLFSVKMEDVKASLEKNGVNVLGKMFFDRAWRADKTLSPWANGRRFCYIEEPSISKPLPKSISIGDFTAFLWYKGMSKEEKRCWDCNSPGHKRGDISCPRMKAGNQQNPWGPSAAKNVSQSKKVHVSKSNDENMQLASEQELTNKSLTDSCTDREILNDENIQCDAVRKSGKKDKHEADQNTGLVEHPEGMSQPPMSADNADKAFVDREYVQEFTLVLQELVTKVRSEMNEDGYQEEDNDNLGGKKDESGGIEDESENSAEEDSEYEDSLDDQSEEEAMVVNEDEQVDDVESHEDEDSLDDQSEDVEIVVNEDRKVDDVESRDDMNSQFEDELCVDKDVMGVKENVDEYEAKAGAEVAEDKVIKSSEVQQDKHVDSPVNAVNNTFDEVPQNVSLKTGSKKSNNGKKKVVKKKAGKKAKKVQSLMNDHFSAAASPQQQTPQKRGHPSTSSPEGEAKRHDGHISSPEMEVNSGVSEIK